MNKYIAVTIGDINGIGIEILLDLYKKRKINKFILFTDYEIINKYLKKYKKYIKINIVNKNASKIIYKNNFLNIYSFESKSIVDNTYKSLRYAYNITKLLNFVGIITLPLRKDLIINEKDKNFIGHTEYFQKIENKKNSNMFLYHKKILVCPITTHKSIRSIPKLLSRKNFLYSKIFSVYKNLVEDFKIKNPKILISGLNPHAGENGKIGTEEIKLIEPCLKKIRKKGISIDGPMSADSMLLNNNLKKYDCFLFCYHDQALIPFKYISNFSGVNYTGNLDILRVSPDHGTAYNLVGKRNVSDKSLLNCFKFIKKISINKINKNDKKSKKITRSKFYK